MLTLLGQEIEHLDSKLNEIEVKLTAAHKANALSQRLATIPGVGRIIALTFATEVDRGIPIRSSSGGLDRANAERTFDRREAAHGRISRAGNERLRRLLVTGATAVIRFATRPGNKHASAWLLNLLKHKPRKLVAVALANKMARIAWAMMKSGENYRRRTAIAATAAA